MTTNGLLRYLPAAAIASSILPTEVLAATSPQNPSAGFGGIFVIWAIVHFSRRRPIGGWLLYFYIQLYFSFVISLIFVPRVLSNLDPTKWDSSLRYVLFFISVVPPLLCNLAEIAFATRLLKRRSAENLRSLRLALYACVVTNLIGLGIDISSFAEAITVGLDSISFFFAIVWSFYFLRSERVRAVFLENNWVYTEDVAVAPLTSIERRYLQKRALISGVVVFFIALVCLGMGQDKLKPSYDLIVLPMVYALFAALIGRYLSLSKGKRVILAEATSTHTTDGSY